MYTGANQLPRVGFALIKWQNKAKPSYDHQAAFRSSKTFKKEAISGNHKWLLAKS
jgi:hypothetical protein